MIYGHPLLPCSRSIEVSNFEVALITVTSMLVTKSVGDNHEMLATVLAILRTNISVTLKTGHSEIGDIVMLVTKLRS